MHEPSGLEPGSSRAGSSPSSPGVPRARVRSSPGLDSARVHSSLLAARESWRAPSLRGRRCCAPSATSHRTRENIYRCSRYMASGNKSTVFIFNWRVFIFAWLFQRKKVACRGILTAQDSSPLDSARVSWRLESARVRSSRLVNNTTRDDTVGPSDEGKRGVSGARDSMPRKVRVSFSSSVEAAPVITNGHFPVQ